MLNVLRNVGFCGPVVVRTHADLGVCVFGETLCGVDDEAIFRSATAIAADDAKSIG